MAHRGCISIDRLPLQILLRDNPEWKGTPVAVTKEEKPQSPILALNREARERGLVAGMRYASALSLVPSLRARAVSSGRVAEAQDRIVRLLFAFTPDIEPCPFDTDAFWVSVDGLRSLFESESRWIEKVRGALAAEGFAASVVVGFTRFGTYAIARSRQCAMVFASRTDECALLSRSSIDILPLPPRTKSMLRKLEIRTVERFVSLPAGETTRRLGKEAGLLRQAILSDDPLPIQPVAVREAVHCARHLDAPLVDLELLMPHIDELLAIEAGRAETEKAVISGLTVILRTEEGEVATEVVRPAVPTLRTPLLRRLIHLRLSARQFSSGVEDIEILSARTQPSRGQEELFSLRGRDLRAGARAFAAIRARFGNDSVTCARLSDSYLPERSFQWVPVQRPVLPAPPRERVATHHPSAVRRILFTPRRMKPIPQVPGEGAEPFVASGSWWGTGDTDALFLRHYFFRGSHAGILWFFVDKLTDTTWVQGVVD
ncbi:MAG: DNA polymerase Y family protein [Spirochaetia bacterium]|jgi:protein ImuB